MGRSRLHSSARDWFAPDCVIRQRVLISEDTPCKTAKSERLRRHLQIWPHRRRPPFAGSRARRGQSLCFGAARQMRFSEKRRLRCCDKGDGDRAYHDGGARSRHAVRRRRGVEVIEPRRRRSAGGGRGRDQRDQDQIRNRVAIISPPPSCRAGAPQDGARDSPRVRATSGPRGSPPAACCPAPGSARNSARRIR